MPIIVGAVVGWFVTRGIELDASFEAVLTLVVTTVLTAVYYIAVRLLETYVSPKFGWLLGLGKAPAYDPEDDPSLYDEAGDDSEAV